MNDWVASLVRLASSCGALLGLIWIGYPLGMAFTSVGPKRRRLQVQADAACDPPAAVSVVIATRDSVDVVKRRVQNVLESRYPHDLLDVIVSVDAEQPFQDYDVLRCIDDRIRVIGGDAPGGKAASINAAVRASTREILIFTDSAQQFDVHTVERLVRALQVPHFGAVSGSLVLGSANGRKGPIHWYWSLEKWLRAREAQVHSSIGVTGAVYAARRALYPEIPTGTILDDLFVPMSMILAGYRIGFEPTATAIDSRVFSAEQERMRKSRTLTGVIQLCVLLPSVLSPSRNPVWTQFILHKLARLLSPFLVVGMALPGLGLAWYGVASASPIFRWVVAALVVLTFSVGKSRHLIGSLLWWILNMQLATFRALANGLGRDWKVWTRSP